MNNVWCSGMLSLNIILNESNMCVRKLLRLFVEKIC